MQRITSGPALLRQINPKHRYSIEGTYLSVQYIEDLTSGKSYQIEWNERQGYAACARNLTRGLPPRMWWANSISGASLLRHFKQRAKELTRLMHATANRRRGPR